MSDHLKPYLTNLYYTVEDLGQREDDELFQLAKADPLAGATLVLMKHVRDPRFEVWVQRVWLSATSMEKLSLDDWTTLTRYLLGTRNALGEDTISAMVSVSLDAENTERVMNLATHLKNKSQKEGLKKGRENAFAETLLRLITLKFGPPNSQTRNHVASASADNLARWTDRILFAETVDELFGSDGNFSS